MKGMVGLSTLAEAIHVVIVQHANEMNLEYHHSRTTQERAAQDSHFRKAQDIYDTLEAMEQSDNPVSTAGMVKVGQKPPSIASFVQPSVYGDEVTNQDALDAVVKGMHGGPEYSGGSSACGKCTVCE